MSGLLFQSGEQVPGQPVPVLNERTVRTGAGLLFLFAMIALTNAWLTGNFAPTRVFVVALPIDFALRLFVNPRFAPSLIVGQWLVRRRQPEWTGAPQKRFAWGIGVFWRSSCSGSSSCSRSWDRSISWCAHCA